MSSTEEPRLICFEPEVCPLHLALALGQAMLCCYRAEATAEDA